MKARKQCHWFEQNYLCKKMCDKCTAIQPKGDRDLGNALNFKNFSPSAPYTAFTMTHDEYLRSAAWVSPWSVLPGWQYESCSFDVMHLIFLGIGKDLVASSLKILRVLGFHYKNDESEEEFLRSATMEMRQECKRHKRHVIY